MKYLLLLAIMILSGCARLSYTRYQGEQQNWPMSKGAFVRTVDGIQIFNAPPFKPYDVLGKIVSKDAAERLLVHCAKTNDADAIFITDVQVVSDGTVTAPGAINTYYSGNTKTTYVGPSLTTEVTTRFVTAWVIKFKDGNSSISTTSALSQRANTSK